MKRLLSIVLILALTASCLTGCGGKNADKGDVVYVYNFGDYLDPDSLDMFEEETGIRVIYDEYETNEIMYPKVESGAVAYDVLCPSDYMIKKLIDEDFLQEINFDNIPNFKNIGDIYKEMSGDFDPGCKYSVPYCWGTLGILYNQSMVDEEITSWSRIFDEKYADSILMIDSVRDAFAIALKYLGYSLNSKDEEELEEAKNLLQDQYSLVQAYVLDQGRDKMINNEAALAVIYSGDAIYAANENPDLIYVVPDEGSNVWIDSWVIPKNAPNKENAEKFIDFMCRPDIALLNFEYLTYSTPNEAGRALIEDEEIRNSTVIYPGEDILRRCEAFSYLGEEMEELYNEKWEAVKSGR